MTRRGSSPRDNKQIQSHIGRDDLYLDLPFARLTISPGFAQNRELDTGWHEKNA